MLLGLCLEALLVRLSLFLWLSLPRSIHSLGVSKWQHSIISLFINWNPFLINSFYPVVCLLEARHKKSEFVSFTSFQSHDVVVMCLIPSFSCDRLTFKYYYEPMGFICCSYYSYDAQIVWFLASRSLSSLILISSDMSLILGSFLIFRRTKFWICLCVPCSDLGSAICPSCWFWRWRQGPGNTGSC